MRSGHWPSVSSQLLKLVSILKQIKLMCLTCVLNLAAPGPVASLNITVVSSMEVVVRWSPVAEQEYVRSDLATSDPQQVWRRGLTEVLKFYVLEAQWLQSLPQRQTEMTPVPASIEQSTYWRGSFVSWYPVCDSQWDLLNRIQTAPVCSISLPMKNYAQPQQQQCNYSLTPR